MSQRANNRGIEIPYRPYGEDSLVPIEVNNNTPLNTNQSNTSQDLNNGVRSGLNLLRDNRNIDRNSFIRDTNRQLSDGNLNGVLLNGYLNRDTNRRLSNRNLGRDLPNGRLLNGYLNRDLPNGYLTDSYSSDLPSRPSDPHSREELSEVREISDRRSSNNVLNRSRNNVYNSRDQNSRTEQIVQDRYSLMNIEYDRYSLPRNHRLVGRNVNNDNNNIRVVDTNNLEVNRSNDENTTNEENRNRRTLMNLLSKIKLDGNQIDNQDNLNIDRNLVGNRISDNSGLRKLGKDRTKSNRRQGLDRSEIEKIEEFLTDETLPLRSSSSYTQPQLRNTDEYLINYIRVILDDIDKIQSVINAHNELINRTDINDPSLSSRDRETIRSVQDYIELLRREINIRKSDLLNIIRDLL